MVDVEGTPTLLRERPGKGTPVVFWHGNPTDSSDWIPFMERLARPSVAPDLPAFGRSGTREGFGFTLDEYGEWAGALLAELGIDRYSLVIHDWGAIGLLPALRHPERVESMVAFNPVPFGVGYRWHWLARWFWRRRPAGEIMNSLARSPGAAGLVMRQARPGFRAMPPDYLERVETNWRRREMRDAVLALYRSPDSERLNAAGSGLEGLTAPALLLWAHDDPYIHTEYGRRLAERLPGAVLEEVADAGHWPWLDRPELINRAVEFLTRADT